MPRLPYIFAALLAVFTLAGVGGWFLMRPAAQPSNPPHDRAPGPNPNPDPNGPSPPAPPADGDAGKLVVLVVFDQMRGDYLTRWADHYGPDGFARMKKDGVWFSECHIPYACTSTGPGHASLATGAPPRDHGIVENAWYDRATKAHMYCCEPKRAFDLIPPVPEKLGKPGRGAANGFSPERLLAPTVGDSLLEASKGKGRVFSLSIKDRTAVLMGGQKPTGAYCFDVRDGNFHTGAYYNRDAVHGWVAELNAGPKGGPRLADSWFNEKWDKVRPDLDYAKLSGPDDVDAEAPGINGQGRTFPKAFKGKLDAPAAPYYAALEASPAGNELLFALAKTCVTAEKLGRGPAPDLLLVSFSSNDLIGHLYGPDSQEMLDVTLRADKLVGELLKFLDAEVGKDRYTLVVSADHGVCPLPELQASKDKYPAAKRTPLLDLGLELFEALDTMYGNPKNETIWFEAFDDNVWPWLYLNHKAIEARKLKVEDVAAVARDWLAGRGYIETAFTRKELEDKNGPDKPFKLAAQLAYHPDRCGDVIVVPKAGVLVTQYKGGTSHGSPHGYDAHVPFLMVGAGVPALGKRAEKVSSLAVAPALARALGVPAPAKAAVLVPEALATKK